jgi:hypothetical protein
MIERAPRPDMMRPAARRRGNVSPLAAACLHRVVADLPHAVVDRADMENWAYCRADYPDSGKQMT